MLLRELVAKSANCVVVVRLYSVEIRLAVEALVTEQRPVFVVWSVGEVVLSVSQHVVRHFSLVCQLDEEGSPLREQALDLIADETHLHLRPREDFDGVRDDALLGVW